MHSKSSNLGQMSVDFLIGMVVFGASIAFVFQFMTASIAPFALSPDEKVVTSHKVSDSLVYSSENLGTGEKGVVDIGSKTNFDNTLDGIKAESLTDTQFLNVTVEGVKEKSFVTIGGDELTYGRSIPDAGASISRSTRLVYDQETEQKVVIKTRVW